MLKRFGLPQSRTGLYTQFKLCFSQEFGHDATKNMKILTKNELESLVLKQYNNGRFQDLISEVIAAPSLLFSACENLSVRKKGAELQNLLASSGYRGIDWKWIGNTCKKLRDGSFDVESNCVRIIPIRKKGESLVLPDLKLKVVIEAIRMVLEVIYDKKFMTFSYGGRVGMGRHTAVRYLKSSVTSPNWWFRVRFLPQRFDHTHVRKLTSLLEEKIDDSSLTDLLSRLFHFGAVCVDFGGWYMGKGLPQESGLSSMLVNIYLNGLDREIQKLRFHIDRTSSEFNLVDEVRESSHVKDWLLKRMRYRSSEDMANFFYKPTKLFCCRYLDDILIISSGSKALTMEMKYWVVEYIESSLQLKIDKIDTVIHSAVSEKMGFLGLELQAVPPSILRPPLSEKALRAKKKYIKQRQARALEERNALETRRKKLGVKILDHVFKKYKRSGGFKYEPELAAVVKEAFGSWAIEVMHEFLSSHDECWEWHHRFTSGDFLYSPSARAQLPRDLLDAYDRFQAQIDRYLNPKKMKEKMVELEEGELEDENRKYSERTVDDLTKLCMKVDAPLELIRKFVKLAGFTNSMGRPQPIKVLIPLEDADIVKWYAGIGKRWLDFYCCCHNFQAVKTIVSYHLRFSCILTLAEKHESTKREAIKHYSKDLKVANETGTEEIYFPTENYIKMMGDRNLSDPKAVDGLLCMAFVRLALDVPSSCCAAHFCDRMDTIAYRVRLLQSRLNVNPFDEKKWIPGVAAIQESIDRKCMLLCSQHINDIYLGQITLQDIDCTSCFNGR